MPEWCIIFARFDRSRGLLRTPQKPLLPLQWLALRNMTVAQAELLKIYFTLKHQKNGYPSRYVCLELCR
jgi:hypothetical protein